MAWQVKVTVSRDETLGAFLTTLKFHGDPKVVLYGVSALGVPAVTLEWAAYSTAWRFAEFWFERDDEEVRRRVMPV